MVGKVLDWLPWPVRHGTNPRWRPHKISTGVIQCCLCLLLCRVWTFNSYYHWWGREGSWLFSLPTLKTWCTAFLHHPPGLSVSQWLVSVTSKSSQYVPRVAVFWLIWRNREINISGTKKAISIIFIGSRPSYEKCNCNCKTKSFQSFTMRLLSRESTSRTLEERWLYGGVLLDKLRLKYWL